MSRNGNLPDPRAEEAALQLLKKKGYDVKKALPRTKRTFEVERQALKQFDELRGKLGLKVKVAITLAIECWLEQHHKK